MNNPNFVAPVGGAAAGYLLFSNLVASESSSLALSPPPELVAFILALVACAGATWKIVKVNRTGFTGGSNF